MAGLGRFVAVGSLINDVSGIGYSTDNGTTWTVPARAEQDGLFADYQGRGIAYGNGRFVAVGDTDFSEDVSHIGYSTDGGETWTVVSLDNTNGLFNGGYGSAIAYGGNDRFVAVGYSQGDVSSIGYSPDGGETWTVAANPDGLFRGGNSGYGIASDGNGLFVAVGDSQDDASNIGYSPDGGETWTVAANPDGLFRGGGGYGVAYSNGTFVAVGQSLNDASNIGYSTNGGQTWTVSQNTNGLFGGPFFSGGYGVASDGNGRFVAVGVSGNDASNIGYSSNGGETWTVVSTADKNGLFSSGGNSYVFGIAYGNGTFVAMGNIIASDVSNIGYSSNGGETWTVVTPTDQNELFSGRNGSYGRAIAFSTPPPPPPPPPPPISNICFPAGTPIKTDQGLFPIENLQSSKKTINKYTINKQPIQHITKTVSQDTHLICFEQHAIWPNVPSEKTIMTKEHKILFEGRYVAAEKFLSLSKKVTKVKYNGELLYNVLLENYGTLQVNNLVCETLHPDNLIAKLYNNYTEAERPDLVCQLNASLLERNVKKYKAVERKILHK
jgi:hypothetical protein